LGETGRGQIPALDPGVLRDVKTTGRPAELTTLPGVAENVEFKLRAGLND